MIFYNEKEDELGKKEMRSSHVKFFIFSNEPEMCDYVALNK